MNSERPDRLIAFSHVPKTGGITLRYLLRRHYGLGHLDLQYRSPNAVYTARDLNVDLKFFPGLRSIAGHTLKPFVDFGPHHDRLAWFTMLRDPTRRFLSHYQHEVEKNGKQLSLHQWAKTFHRHDWQVRMFAGEEDVEAAKQILAERFQAVLFQEDYDLSLKILKHRLALNSFDLAYDRPKNTSGKQMKEKLLADIENYRDLIEENNSLDCQLYDFAKNTLWPQQLQQLPADTDEPAASTSHRTRLSLNYLRRNLIYKPFCKLDRFYVRHLRSGS